MSTRVNRTRLVLGITGPLGAGVSTVAAALEANGFKRFRLSDLIKAELRKREKLPEIQPINQKTVKDCRKKLQDIGNEGREKNPMAWVEPIIAQVPAEGDIVIDGIRNTAEAVALRDRYPHFFLLAVNASTERRWQRVQDEYDKNLKAFEEDDRRDSDEDIDHGQQVTRCVQMADYVFINETDAGSSAVRGAQLFGRIRTDLELMRSVDKSSKATGFIRPPTPEEVHMATAYSQSHTSQCLKRHVGAVIVGENGLPLSLGFNENPLGMQPCPSAYGFCFKDEDMHKKLETMEAHCPNCGEKNSGIKKPWRCGKCGKSLKNLLFPSRNMELCTAIHAEERAVRSLNGRDATGGTLFTTTFPCFQCSRYIKDAGIRRVVFVEAYPVKEAMDFLKHNDIIVEPFQGFKARAFNLVFKQVD